MDQFPGKEPLDFIRSLEADLANPGLWPSLSEERICQVIGNAILVYAEFTAEGLIPLVMRMYPYFAERVSAAKRFAVLQNITHRFSNDESVPDDATRQRVDALLPFIANDPDTTIVSTATLDFALLRGRVSNPWIGVDQAFSMFEGGRVKNQPAILIGLVALGDRRLSARILELLKASAPDVAQAVSKFNPSFVFAATVELVCDWLEWLLDASAEQDPRGSTLGHVAASLHRLATLAEDTGVLDISRCFPPASPTESAVENGRWTRAEYARALAPRLQALAVVEREPRILPEVMSAWGLQFVNPN